MSELLVFVVLGLGSGGLIAGLGIGVVLSYRGAGVINMAAGAIAMLAGFFFWFAASGGDSTSTNLAFGLSTAGVALAALGVWGIWFIAHERNAEAEPPETLTAAVSPPGSP